MLHLRPARKAVAEMVDEEEIEHHQLYDGNGKALPEWIRFDPETGKATKVGKPKKGKKIATGSMLQVELHCKDCKAQLVPSDAAIGLLVCSRINRMGITTEDGFVPALTAVRVVTDGRHEWIVDPAPPEPKADSVLECGRLGL